MLDTGIDVPEILNLVFFKKVRSKTKFNQMIGRGTRLCEDLFGPGDDKEYFVILDFLGNFKFFEQNPEGAPTSKRESLIHRIFRNRLFLASTLKEDPWSEKPTLIKMRTDTLDLLHKRVSMMNEDNFLVRPHCKYLHKFKERSRWNNLTDNDQIEILEHLADLPSELDTDDEYAKRFDLLILNLQLALLEDDPGIERQMDRVKYLGERLENKFNIPQVKKQETTIREIQTDEFWKEVTLPRIEKVRQALRNLINFIDKEDKKEMYTNFTDTLGMVKENETGQFRELSELKQYRLKVAQYIKEHENQMTIYKLKHNKSITPKDIEALEEMLFNSEVAESKERFEESYKNIKGLGPFVRSLVGLDKQAVQQLFSDYLQDGSFSSRQINFIKKIVDYLTHKGTMEPEQLYEPPFTEKHYEGVDGIFPKESANIVSIIRGINKNAVA